MTYAYRVEPGERVDLATIDPEGERGIDKAAGEARFRELAKELGDLQELLFAAGDQSLLVVLQGMDTSGKDGAIRHVFAEMDPQGVRVATFGVPTPLERAHDFLWRCHAAAPELGKVVLFNRSHYEAVLVERVKEIVPERVWRKRYGQIVAFEGTLASERTLVLKFYLHISKDEQRQRLMDREADVEKAWKLNANDWVERRNWEAYIAAYEDALSRTSMDDAPWFVVPANRKWYRNLAIAEAIVAALRPYREGWLATLAERGAAELPLVRAEREREEQARA
jgi:PPK2 family polyphosphate:nucleotide phosphotransferase